MDTIVLCDELDYVRCGLASLPKRGNNQCSDRLRVSDSNGGVHGKAPGYVETITGLYNTQETSGGEERCSQCIAESMLEVVRLSIASRPYCREFTSHGRPTPVNQVVNYTAPSSDTCQRVTVESGRAAGRVSHPLAGTPVVL
jgi:hypothetical protein